MKISGNAGVAAAQGLTRKYQPQSPAAAQPQKEDRARRFDSVTLSAQGQAMEAKRRIGQEVRAAGTASAESAAALREQVRSGSYQPDARETARKMLLEGSL